MRVAIDFDNPERAGRVPSHGWAKNSQGIKLLWLPVLRLVHQANTVRTSAGCTAALTRGQWGEIHAFGQTTQRLAVALRDLAKLARLGANAHPGGTNTDDFRAAFEALELLPLCIDITFTYLRRFADQLAAAGRYVLFRHVKSAPMQFRKLREAVAEPNALGALGPLCDPAILRDAFQAHSGWLDLLRRSATDPGQTAGGIRDIMEHHPVAVRCSLTRQGEEPWQVVVDLGDPSLPSNFRGDLLPTVSSIVAEIAALLTGICQAAHLPPASQLWGVPYGDALVLTGQDDDTTAFWPESL